MRPARPILDLPWFPHVANRRATNIHRMLVYFGPWNDWEGALQKYKAQAGGLHAGSADPTVGGSLAVKALLKRFLTTKGLAKGHG